MPRRWLLPALVCVLLATGPARAQEPAPVELIERLELHDARVVDVLRLLGELSSLNVVASEAAGQKKVTLYLRNVTPRLAVETTCRASGLWFREDVNARLLRVLTTEEYQKDLVVFREDRTRVFTLLHPNAVPIATAIEDVLGERVILSLGVSEDVAGFSFAGRNPLLSFAGGPANVNGNLGGAQAASGGFGGGFSSGGLGAGLANDGTGVAGVPGNGRGSSRRTTRTQPAPGDGPSRTSENLVDERFTPDQLREIEQRQKARAEARPGTVGSEDLRGISRREPPIYVSVNSPHNVIIVRTSDDRAMDEIERLVRDLDRPMPQVLLEVKVLELDLQDTFTSVFDFDFVDGGTTFPGNSVGGKTNPFLAGGATAPRNVVGAGNFSLNPASTLVYQFLNDRIRARVQLLEQENRLNALATPLLLCTNHGVSRIFVGEERPLVRGFEAQQSFTQTTSATLVVPQTQLRNIGTSLMIVPQINADRTVTLTIVQESSTLRPGAANVPVPLQNGQLQDFAVDTVSTSNVSGTVVAKDGLTVAVGGLIQDRIRSSEDKVPFLGDLPLLGVLFRSTVRARARSELILLIKPHVLTTPAEAHAASRERLVALSIHPYQDRGDRASRAFEKHDVPEADRSTVFLRDLLAPDPEKSR